jgi:RimJ/RimL family protein N-acetyltransferase
MRLPELQTARLLVRPFSLEDLESIHRLLDVDLADAEMGTTGAHTREERWRWLQWTVLNYDQLARLYQPPYGERAIVLRETGQLIGAVGYVPCLNAFGLLPALGSEGEDATALTSTEFGLFWAVSPAQQRRGYAAEAAGALVDYAFRELRLRRIVATTSYDNAASQGVMRRLGMSIHHNPYPEPPWLQVVGVLHHPDRRPAGARVTAD